MLCKLPLRNNISLASLTKVMQPIIGLSASEIKVIFSSYPRTEQTIPLNAAVGLLPNSLP